MNTFILLLASLLQTSPAPSPVVVYNTRIETQSWNASRVDITGDGWLGTDITGPIVQFVGTDDGFVLGDGDPYRATGGRIERIKVVRKGTGGDAIKLLALSGAFRPGQYVIRDLLILGDSDLHGSTTVDNWNRGLVVDGSKLPKAQNADGVRCIRVDNVRIAGCLGDSVRLSNVVHFHGTAIQVDPGSAKRVPTVVIDGCQHVFLQANIFGEVHIRNSSVVRFDGYAQVVRIDATCVDVTVTGTAGKSYVAKGAKRVNINGTGVSK